MISYKELNDELLFLQAPKAWFPHARQHGLNLRVGDLEGSKGASLWICLRTGRWFDHATGEGGGDLISLYAAMHHLSQSGAARELERGGCSSVANAMLEVPKMSQANDAGKQDYISKLWKASVPAQGTQVEAYLETRGVAGILPQDIRCALQLFHRPFEQSFPAMLAAVRHGTTGQVMAVHRTWLKPDGSGKADIDPNKMMLGKVLGGAVRLAEAASEMMVAEGIETALSAMQITGVPTWAALSTAGLKGLVLPPLVKRVVIASDSDPAGVHAASVAADRWRSEGREVATMTPPSSQDFNDVLMEIKKNEL